MFFENSREKFAPPDAECRNCEANESAQGTIFCSNCGQKISAAAIMCPHCGAGTERYRKDQEKAAQQPAINIVNNNANTNSNVNTNVNSGVAYRYKSKWTAFFLCLFAGFLGVHRFYVGKTGSGILFFFTVGLFGIGWIVDLIAILSGGFRDKFGMPLA